MNVCLALHAFQGRFYTDPQPRQGRSAKKLIFPLAFPVNCLGFRKLFRDYNIDYSFSVFTTEDLEGRGSAAEL